MGGVGSRAQIMSPTLRKQDVQTHYDDVVAKHHTEQPWGQAKSTKAELSRLWTKSQGDSWEEHKARSANSDQATEKS